MGNGVAIDNRERKMLKDQRQHSKFLNKTLRKDQLTNAKLIKILLLGEIGVEKTIGSKQTSSVQQERSSTDNEDNFGEKIENNTIDSLVQLVDSMRKTEVEPIIETELILRELSPCRKLLEKQREAKMSKHMADIMSSLLYSKIIQKAYEKRFCFRILDSAKYLLDSLDRAAGIEYEPLNEDIIRFQCHTTGINRVEFVIRDNQYLMIDIGGLKSDRSKWLHCFQDVYMLLLIISISDYDDLEAELQLQDFSKVLKSKWFKEVPLIIFLNKYDDPKEELSICTQYDLHPAMIEEIRVREATKYLENYFEKLFMDKRHIYVYPTSANDTRQVEYMFSAVMDKIVNDNLRQAGLY